VVLPAHEVFRDPPGRLLVVGRVPGGQIHWYDPIWLVHRRVPGHNWIPWMAAMLHSSTSGNTSNEC